MTTITDYTKLIRISDRTYPVYMPAVRKENPLKSFAINPTVLQISKVGYAVVEPVDRPTGDVVTEGDPELDNGVYKQTWVVRSFNADELAANLSTAKTTLQNQLNTYCDNLLELGVSYDFGGTDGTQHVQVRDGDRANLASLRIKAQNRIAASDETVALFRTYENKIISMTPEQIVTMTDAAFDGYYAILAGVWALKDQATNATDLAGLPAVPALPS